MTRRLPGGEGMDVVVLRDNDNEEKDGNPHPVEKAVLDVVAKLELPFSPLRRSSAVPSSKRATICPIDIYRR